MRRLLVTTAVLTLLLSQGAPALTQAEQVAAGTFEPTDSLEQARSGHSATLLPDGRVLVSGGNDAADEVWDPMTGLFTTATDEVASATDQAPPLAVVRVGHTSTLLPDGSSLVVGGRGPGDAQVAKAQVYDPGSRRLEPAGSLAELRTDHTSTFLRDGRVLVVGGTGTDGPLTSAEVWTSSTRAPKCFGKRATLFALPGVEFVGTDGPDVIAGSVGDDIIAGGGGKDRICAGGGADSVTGGPGADQLSGGRGHDELDGGKGKDVCAGGKGINWLPSCNEKLRDRGTMTVAKNTKLRGPHKGRFIIGRDGVTLDCQGHSITGPGRRTGVDGIVLSGHKGVTVRNCDVYDFRNGFFLTRSHRNTLSNNRVSHVGRGFQLEGSDRNKLIANRVIDADVSSLGWGCCGYALDWGSDKNRLRENVAIRGGFGIGIWESRGNLVADNVAQNSRMSGFFVAGHTSDGSRSRHNAANNTFLRNSSIDSGFSGYIDTTSGFTGDAGTDNHYVDNTCAGNAHGGSDPATLCVDSAP